MIPSFSARSRDIQPFHVMALLARAQALQARGHDVIHLEVGEPDFPTAAPIVAAAQAALAAGHTRYTPACGLPALREAIAGFYAQRYGVSLDPGRILVTPGGRLSLQYHRHRSEQWVVVEGRATVQRGEETIELEPNQSIYVPTGEKHRLENRTREPLVLVEVQCGDYVGEDDIVRLEDVYGRPDSETSRR